jgi:hypothetical protein
MNTISTILVRGIERLRRMRRPLRFVFITGMVLLVGLVDYLTADRLDLSVFYLPLVVVTVWVAGLRASMCVALLASVLWLVDDSGTPTSRFL